MRAALERLERHPARVIFGIGALMLAAYVSSLVLLRKPDGRIVLGDAVHYYVYVRSAVYDRDLAFRNEYVRLYGLKGGEPGTEWVHEPTATGLTRNMMAIGTPIAWTPLFTLATAIVSLARAVGVDYPLDGYGRVFQATAGMSGVVCGVLGAWLAYGLARCFTSARVALWATLLVWLGSQSIYYTFISPTYSHAVSMLATGAVLLYWARTQDRQTPLRYAALGGLIGLAALVRWQDAVFLLVAFVDAVCAVRTRRLTPAGGAVALGACAAAALAAFSPQMIVWTTLYAAPLTVPQGAGFMRWTEPQLWAVLFDDWHGLFAWSPVLAVGLAGLWPLWRRHPRAAAAMTAVLIVSWYSNAAVQDWWAGEAYGARRFLSCFPIFVVGAAAALERWTPRTPALATVTALFVAHNVLLLLQYQLFMHGLRTIAPYPQGAYNLWVARFVVPIDLVRWWLGGGGS